jgi:hypothetical protein
MLRPAIWQKLADASEMLTASIIRALSETTVILILIALRNLNLARLRVLRENPVEDILYSTTEL